ncbi:MAG: VOC family protein [Deltaproteobacteria bacterium]|nr:VOC family protein [Deltaproteobacteria bacterium]
MLGETDVIATIGVKDLDVARAFYVDKLGLRDVGAVADHLLELRSGISRVFVYISEFAGTNRATAVTWAVIDVDAMVATLREKGVTFEHYDEPGMTREGDVHMIRMPDGQEIRNAWCKDPDGNILSIVNGG